MISFPSLSQAICAHNGHELIFPSLPAPKPGHHPTTLAVPPLWWLSALQWLSAPGWLCLQVMMPILPRPEPPVTTHRLPVLNVMKGVTLLISPTALFGSQPLASLFHNGKAATLSAGKGHPGFASFAHNKNAGEPGGKVIAIGICHMNYIKRTRASLSAGGHASSSQASTSGHHTQATSAGLNEVSGFARTQINRKCAVHRDEGIRVAGDRASGVTRQGIPVMPTRIFLTVYNLSFLPQVGHGEQRSDHWCQRPDGTSLWSCQFWPHP